MMIRAISLRSIVTLALTLSVSLPVAGVGLVSHAALFAGVQQIEILSGEANQPVVLRFQADLPFQVQRQYTSDQEIVLRLHNARLSDSLVGPDGLLNIGTSGSIQSIEVKASESKDGAVDLVIRGTQLSSLKLVMEGATELPVVASEHQDSSAKRPVVSFPEIASAASSPSDRPTATRIDIDSQPDNLAAVTPPTQASRPATPGDIEKSIGRPQASGPQLTGVTSMPTPASYRNLPAQAQTVFPASQSLAYTAPVATAPVIPQPASTPSSTVEAEPVAPPHDYFPNKTLPRYEGGAPPIQASAISASGRTVQLKPLSGRTATIDLQARNESYNTLFHAESGQTPEVQVNQLMNQALALYRSRNYTAAQSQIQQAIALQPQNPDLRIALAEIQVALKQYDAAETTYQRALVLAPSQADKHRERYAQVLTLAGRRLEAIQVLEELYQRNPDQPNVAYMLGTLHEELGQTQRALPYLQKAVTLTPASVEIQYNLGLAYELIGQTAAAAEHYAQAIALNPDAQDARRALARVQR